MSTLKFSTKVAAFLFCQMEYLLAPVLIVLWAVTDIFLFALLGFVFVEQRAIQMYHEWRVRANFVNALITAIDESEEKNGSTQEPRT